jgi:FHA domain-containing protein
MSLLSEIEKSIDRAFRAWTQRAFGRERSDDLVILHRSILSEIENKVEVLARGKKVFPFGKVTVTIVGDTPRRREVLQAAFGERLQTDLISTLKSAHCEIPDGFSLELRVVESGFQPVEIEYTAKPDKREPPPPKELPPGKLVVVKGRAEQGEYPLEKPRINIGRLPEVTDSLQRVMRRNDIVFEDGVDEVSGTVSRKHAHILFERGEYLIFDDRSEFGTSVFRDGRSIEVLKGARRGEKLQPGDEIYLGRACLRFERDDRRP